MKIPVYQLIVNEQDQEDLGLQINSFVKNPAMMVRGVYKSQDNLLVAKEVQKMSEEGLFTSAVLVPNMLTLEFDKDNQPYYDVWKEDDIKATHIKAMKDRTLFNIDLDHSLEVVDKDAVVLHEVWLVEDPNNDKANTPEFVEQFKELGYAGLPKGTLMATYKVYDESIREKIKSGDITGMSVYGQWAAKLDGGTSLNRNYESKIDVEKLVEEIVYSSEYDKETKYALLLELGERIKNSSES
jgi:hypothetical protein